MQADARGSGVVTESFGGEDGFPIGTDLLRKKHTGRRADQVMSANVIAPLLELDDSIGLRGKGVDPYALREFADDDQSVTLVAASRGALEDEDVHVNV